MLAGDKFMSEMHLRQPEFTYTACGPFTKKKRDYPNLKRQEIQDIFTKTNYKNLAFSMKYYMKILKIYLEQQVLIKHHLMKNFILLNI